MYLFLGNLLDIPGMRCISVWSVVLFTGGAVGDIADTIKMAEYAGVTSCLQ